MGGGVILRGIRDTCDGSRVPQQHALQLADFSCRMGPVVRQIVMLSRVLREGPALTALSSCHVKHGREAVSLAHTVANEQRFS